MTTTPIAKITSGDDKFDCEPYRAVLRASACIARQDKLVALTKGPKRAWGGAAPPGDFTLCRACAVGPLVRQRVAGGWAEEDGDVIETLIDGGAEVAPAPALVAEPPAAPRPKAAPPKASTKREKREAVPAFPPAPEGTPPTSGVMTVTPDLARTFLESNVNNRSISADRVTMYAKDMVAGAWDLNHQGIAFDRNGLLIDGQHRVSAVIRADVPVAMWVFRNVDPNTKGSIDATRPRNVGDTIRILDNTANAGRLVGAFRCIETVLAGHSRIVSYASAKDLMAKYDASLSWFNTKAPKKRPLGRNPVLGALLYAHHVAPELTAAFTAAMCSAAGHVEGSAVLALRTYLIESALIARESDRMITSKVLRCVLAHERGEQLSHIKPSDEGVEHFRKLHLERDGAT